MSERKPFDALARLPTDDDNIAIATRPIEAGTVVELGDATLTISHTILEGHRFACQTVESGAYLTSWGLPVSIPRPSITSQPRPTRLFSRFPLTRFAKFLAWSAIPSRE